MKTVLKRKRQRGENNMKTLHRKRELGLTLVELLIAMSISLIGFAAGYILLQSGYKSLNVGKEAAEAQQKVRIAIETMIQEFQETSADTVWVTGEAISFASAKAADYNFATNEDGTPDWQKAVVYFRDAGSNTLFKYEETKDDWTTNFDSSFAFEAEEGALKKMATSVNAITFQLSPNNLLSVTIEFIKDAEGEGMPEELTTAVRLQN